MSAVVAGCVELLRHGDTGHTGFRGRMEDPLTSLGWSQMEQALQDDFEWDVVLSSPRIRCAQFASVFAARHQLPLNIDERLAELDFGAWEGVSVADLQRTQPELLGKFWQDPWKHPPPQGESLQRFEQRLRAAHDNMLRQYPEQRVLVITHAGVIRILLYLTHQLAPQALLQCSIPHASRHRLDTRFGCATS